MLPVEDELEGARVVDERLALLPHAAEAVKETERRARVSATVSFFMGPGRAKALPAENAAKPSELRGLGRRLRRLG